MPNSSLLSGVTGRTNDRDAAVERRSSGTAGASDGGSSASRLGWVLLGLAVVAAAVVLARRRDRLGSIPDSVPTADELRDRLPVEAPSATGPGSTEGDGSTASEEVPADVPTVDDADAEEIVEDRGTDDVREEPVEPGEMAIDEEVVEQVTDDGAGEQAEGEVGSADGGVESADGNSAADEVEDRGGLNEETEEVDERSEMDVDADASDAPEGRSETERADESDESNAADEPEEIDPDTHVGMDEDDEDSGATDEEAESDRDEEVDDNGRTTGEEETAADGGRTTGDDGT